MSVSNLTSTDVRLATTVGKGQLWDVIGQRQETHYKQDGLAYPKLFIAANENVPQCMYHVTIFAISMLILNNQLSHVDFEKHPMSCHLYIFPCH